MNDVDRIRGLKKAVAARLHAIPGVHAVGVGAKVVGGKKTDELAITVFVVRKKKPEELAKEERVPTEIEGIKTDVVQLARARLANADPHSITATVAPIPPDEGGGQSVTFTGPIAPKVPEWGLYVIVDLTIQASGEQPRNIFVAAESNGRKSLLDLVKELEHALNDYSEVVVSSSIDVWPQLQILATTDSTVQVTRAYVVAIDHTKYFKDYVRGGIQIQRGAYRFKGTLGIVATTQPTAEDPQGKVVGLTNLHVVCPEDVDQTNLTAVSDDNSMGLTFTIPQPDSVVDAGTLVVLMVRELHTAPVLNILFNAFYVTQDGDQPDNVASGIAGAATGAPAGLGISQSPAGSEHVALTSTLAQPVGLDFRIFGSPNSDPKAHLSALVTKLDAATNVVKFAGKVSSGDYGIFVKIDPGRLAFTFGCFTNPKKEASLDDVAAAVLQSFAALPDSLKGTVTAESGGAAAVKINGAEEVECRIISDIQVGQPDNYFGSTCSHCCSHRIGRIVDAQIHSDVALIQLDPDLDYKLEIQDIAGGITGVLAPSVGLLVEQRGRSSGVRHGSVSHIDVSTIVEADNGFFRLSEHGFLIDSDGDQPFILDGDSGAAVISNNALVGLLWGSHDTIGTAMDIVPLVAAFPNLNLSFVPAPGTSADTIQKVPKPAASAFQAVEDPALQGVKIPENFALGFAGTRLGEKLDKAENEIRQTVLGRECSDIVRRHMQEAFTLVNRNRRVATVWHRTGGPEIANALLRVLQFRNERLPEQINGKPLIDCLRRLQRVVMRYASPEFSADLSRCAPQVERFLRMTYPELLASFKSAASE